jgi:hypothetical protein
MEDREEILSFRCLSSSAHHHHYHQPLPITHSEIPIPIAHSPQPTAHSPLPKPPRQTLTAHRPPFVIYHVVVRQSSCYRPSFSIRRSSFIGYRSSAVHHRFICIRFCRLSFVGYTSSFIFSVLRSSSPNHSTSFVNCPSSRTLYRLFGYTDRLARAPSQIPFYYMRK